MGSNIKQWTDTTSEVSTERGIMRGYECEWPLQIMALGPPTKIELWNEFIDVRVHQRLESCYVSFWPIQNTQKHTKASSE
jgi:hypothetical protein